jgi:hypothetical protein
VAHVDVDLAQYSPPSLEGEATMDDHLRRWVGLGGLAVVVVLLLSVFAIPQSPEATASPAKVAAYVHQHQAELKLNALLTSMAVLVAASFLWYLREVIAPALPGRRLANLGFAGGLLFLVGGVLSAGTSFAMADVARHADPNVLQTLNIFSQDVVGYAGAATALLMGATSLGILRSKALPSWLAYVGLVLALATFALPPLGLPGVALWFLVTSIVILATSRRRALTGEPAPSV